jgi:hypothetical protein
MLKIINIEKVQFNTIQKSALHTEKDKNILGKSNILQFFFGIRKMKAHYFLALNNSLNAQ